MSTASFSKEFNNQSVSFCLGKLPPGLSYISVSAPPLTFDTIYLEAKTSSPRKMPLVHGTSDRISEIFEHMQKDIQGFAIDEKTRTLTIQVTSLPLQKRLTSVFCDQRKEEER